MEVLQVQEPKVGRKWPRFVDKLWVRTQMGEKGRLVIPAALREAMGMADGDVLDMRVVDGELRIATMRERLRRAQERLAAMHGSSFLPTGRREITRRALEARNLHTVAELMVQAALGREESRGAHCRKDFPGRADVGRHSVIEWGRLRFVES